MFRIFCDASLFLGSTCTLCNKHVEVFDSGSSALDALGKVRTISGIRGIEIDEGRPGAIGFVTERNGANFAFHHSKKISSTTMARIGLRMMPPFPWSPLSSVRRVFPSTAGRLAFQVVPFLMSLRLSQH